LKITKNDLLLFISKHTKKARHKPITGMNPQSKLWNFFPKFEVGVSLPSAFGGIIQLADITALRL
jgi:hypothetical protein